MNKNSIFNVVLGIAVVILFILHFSSAPKPEPQEDEDQNVEVKEDSTKASDLEIVQLSDSIGIDSLKLKESVKIGYFQLENLVQKCPYLKSRTQEIMQSEQRLMQSFRSKEEELYNFQKKKEKELQDLERKQLLSPQIAQSMQREVMEKQQMMQQNLANEEQKMGKRKEAFVVERDKIIFEAIQKLNEVMDLDYVLIDNLELRLVVPLNDRNNITEELSQIINKNYK